MRETDLLRRAADILAAFADPGRVVWGSISGTRADAASLLALADEMERAEPVACSCELGEGHSAELRNAHTPLYTHPAPDVQRDADRYRWLRDHACYRYSDGNDGPVLVCRDDDEDAAIDTAMQEPKP